MHFLNKTRSHLPTAVTCHLCLVICIYYTPESHFAATCMCACVCALRRSPIITKQWNVGITFHYRNRHYFYIARSYAQNMWNALDFSCSSTSHQKQAPSLALRAKLKRESEMFRYVWNGAQVPITSEIEEINGKHACTRERVYFIGKFPLCKALLKEFLMLPPYHFTKFVAPFKANEI